jgi:hypothetical protein
MPKIKWWMWAAAVAGAWVAFGRKKAAPALRPAPWAPGEDIQTETGQDVEIEEGGGHVSTGDYLNIAPFQIYWTDEFLYEVHGRQNSIAARMEAFDARIYREVQGNLRQVGTLKKNGEYYPIGSKYPLPVASLAYEEGRAPFRS